MKRALVGTLIAVVAIWVPATGSAENSRLISTADFSGWDHSGAGHFEASTHGGKVVYATRGGIGLLWFEEVQDDFRLSFRFKVSPEGGNSGVFLRVPHPDGDRYIYESFEVQIDPRGAGTSATGAIYDVQPPLVLVVPEPGTWYRMVVTAKGERIKVFIDDILVNDFQARPGGKVESYELQGHIGLQNHSDSDVVRFRGIRLRHLS